MSNSVIQIKRSTTDVYPSNVVFGELAFTSNGDVLFIGNESNTAIAIGGERFPGVLTANQAIVVDANSFVNLLNTVDLFVSNSANIEALTVNTSINATDINVANTLSVNGDIVLRGSSIQFGDGGDVISLQATVNTSIVPTDNVSYDLGSTGYRWRQVYANQITVATDPVANLEVATKQYVDNVEAQLNGNNIIIGLPTDGAYSNGEASNSEGAALGITGNTKIAEAVDLLNEVMYNIYQNTYVRDVQVTCTSGNAGGVPLTATLTITTNGNPNSFDINWGDGSWTNATTDSTPSHTYTDDTNSPFDITVFARNTNALGAGNVASVTATDLITLFTGDPEAALQLYDAVTDGSAITEANINQVIYLENDTTNSNGVSATFHIDWGDGSNDSISNTSVAGGPEGDRISHTYTSGTGVGTNTVTLSINTHSTADPAVLPDSATRTIKIFDTSIAAPEGLSSKSFTLTTGSTGSSPRLASGYINNTSEGTWAVGDSVTRYTSGTIQTSGEANSQVVYDASAGTLSAIVDGAVDGSITFDSSDNTGSNASLVVVDELDFYNFSDTGTSVSASTRRYAPGLYSGFRARISKGSLATGTHTYKLSHTTTGNTGVLEFVQDNLTGTPVLDMSSATLTQNSAGTLAYVSGIPYYTNDAVLDVSGITVSNVAGQTYRNDTTPFTIQNGSMVEHDFSNVFQNQTKTYSLLPSGSLNSGNPIANTGVGSSVALEDFTINVNAGGRCVSYFQMYMRNVNGDGTTVQFANTKVQAYNGHSSGVREDQIAVSDSLGSTFDTDGVRIVTGWSGATPAFSSSQDYYASNNWTGAVTIAGTDEAVVRYGDLVHYTTDLSSGYLPAGPDLNTGRSGTQYFRFAFKRTAMANFTVRLTGSVSSFHIAAPGTNIDSTSELNGWLSAGDTYAGAGTPGANTAAGGNGSDGCAFTSGDRIQSNTNYSNQTFTLTLGDQNATSAYNNQVLISIGVASGQSVTRLEIE